MKRIAILVAAVILAGGGYALGQQRNEPTATMTPVSESTTTTTPPTTTTTQPVEDYYEQQRQDAQDFLDAAKRGAANRIEPDVVESPTSYNTPYTPPEIIDLPDYEPPDVMDDYWADQEAREAERERQELADQLADAEQLRDDINACISGSTIGCSWQTERDLEACANGHSWQCP